MITKLVKIRHDFIDIHVVARYTTTTGVNLTFTSGPNVIHLDASVQKPLSWINKWMQYWSVIINASCNDARCWIRNGHFSRFRWHEVFLNTPSWAVHFTYHTILKATPGAAILVGIYCSISTSLLSGKQLEIRQRQTDLNTTRKKISSKVWSQVGDRVLLWNMGINRK